MRSSLIGLAFASLLCIGAGAGGLAGCGSMQALTGSPTTATVNTVAAAETTYTATAKLATAYLNSGKATPAQASVIARADNLVHADIVAARMAVAKGDNPALAVAMKTLNQDLPAFAALVPSTGGSN